jgi:cell wall-associated NlpC family hydrolase
MAAVKQLIDVISKMAEEVVTNVIKSKTLCLADNEGETCINRSQLNNVLSNTGTQQVVVPTTWGTQSTSDQTSTTTATSTVENTVVSEDATNTQNTTTTDETVADNTASTTTESVPPDVSTSTEVLPE